MTKIVLFLQTNKWNSWFNTNLYHICAGMLETQVKKSNGRNAVFHAAGRLSDCWGHLMCHRRRKLNDCFYLSPSDWRGMCGLWRVKFHHKLLMMSWLRWKMDTPNTRKGRMNADFNDSFFIFYWIRVKPYLSPYSAVYQHGSLPVKAWRHFSFFSFLSV